MESIARPCDRSRVGDSYATDTAILGISGRDADGVRVTRGAHGMSTRVGVAPLGGRSHALSKDFGAHLKQMVSLDTLRTMIEQNGIRPQSAGCQVVRMRRSVETDGPQGDRCNCGDNIY